MLFTLIEAWIKFFIITSFTSYGNWSSLTLDVRSRQIIIIYFIRDKIVIRFLYIFILFHGSRNSYDLCIKFVSSYQIYWFFSIWSFKKSHDNIFLLHQIWILISAVHIVASLKNVKVFHIRDKCILYRSLTESSILYFRSVLYWQRLNDMEKNQFFIRFACINSNRTVEDKYIDISISSNHVIG